MTATVIGTMGYIRNKPLVTTADAAAITVTQTNPSLTTLALWHKSYLPFPLNPTDLPFTTQPSAVSSRLPTYVTLHSFSSPRPSTSTNFAASFCFSPLRDL